MSTADEPVWREYLDRRDDQIERLKVALRKIVALANETIGGGGRIDLHPAEVMRDIARAALGDDE